MSIFVWEAAKGFRQKEETPPGENFRARFNLNSLESSRARN